MRGRILVPFVVVFLFLMSLPTATAPRTWIYWGDWGDNLRLRIDFETEPKVGVDTEIILTFQTNGLYDVNIDYIMIAIRGGGIVFPGPEKFDDETVARNMNLSINSSFNASYTVKPSEDGLILCSLGIGYTAIRHWFPNITDSDNGRALIQLGYARVVTTNELWLLLSIFVAATVILSFVVFMLWKLLGSENSQNLSDSSQSALKPSLLRTSLVSLLGCCVEKNLAFEQQVCND